ncbi:DsbA family protein [Microbacterium sp. NPDC055903]
MAAAAQSKPNWFVIGVSAAVVVVLVAIGGLVVFLNNQATAPGVAPESSAIVDSETGAISFGEGETTVDTYIDFMCPICGQFEDAYGEALQTAAANDDITLRIHPISILNAQSQGTEYSSRAASAMYCVASEAPDSALAFMNLLFENQPGEGTAGLTDDQLIAYAEEVGAGAAADCITDGTYKAYSEDQVDNTPPDPTTGRVGTPTVAIDGERIDNGDIATRFAEILG